MIESSSSSSSSSASSVNLRRHRHRFFLPLKSAKPDLHDCRSRSGFHHWHLPSSTSRQWHRVGPRFEAQDPSPPSNFNEPVGDRIPPPNAWRPLHLLNMGPSSNFGPHGLGCPLLPRSSRPEMPMNPWEKPEELTSSVRQKQQQMPTFQQYRSQLQPPALSALPVPQSQQAYYGVASHQNVQVTFQPLHGTQRKHLLNDNGSWTYPITDIRCIYR